MRAGFMIALGVAALATPMVAQAQSKVFEAKLFSSEVKNIRHLKSGKTLVTVEFRGKMAGGGHVELYGPRGTCQKSATLIDVEGNEYGTNRCMSLVTSVISSGSLQGVPICGSYLNRIPTTGPGFLIEGSNTNTFVYEFSTPQITTGHSVENIDLVIPVVYKWMLPGDDERISSTTISFYGIGK